MDRWARVTSRLRIEGTTKSSRKARGFVFGNGMASAAEVKPKAGFGFRVSAAWPSSASISKSLRVPIRVCRPLLTGEALRRSPLMEASGAYPASVEGVPLIAATARPAVIVAGRPAAEWAPNARTGRVEAFLLFGLAINNNRGVIREGVHARLLSPSSGRPMRRKIQSLLRKKSRPFCQIVCIRLIESHCSQGCSFSWVVV